MMNLNTITVNSTSVVAATKKVNTFVNAVYMGAAAYTLLKQKGVEGVPIDRYNKVMYFVVTIKEKVVTEDDQQTKVTTFFDLKSPVMVTSDLTAAVKSFDYLRGQKLKVALLATDPMQRSVANVTKNGHVRLEQSGLLVVRKARDGKWSTPTYKYMVSSNEGTIMKCGSGEQLLEDFKQCKLQAVVHDTSYRGRAERPELSYVKYHGTFRITRATVIQESSYWER